MLNSIISFSIRNKFIIGLFTLALIIIGIWNVTQLPIDAVPDITDNQVQIITVSPSLAAQECERLISFPVEQTMATIPEIKEMRSLSRFGLSIVTIVFKENVNIYSARQQVFERLQQAKEQIPQGVGSPELAPLTTGLGEIYQYIIRPKKGFESKYSITELRTIQDWIIRRQLLGTEGVADVSSFGGYVKQYEISIDSYKLNSMNITIDDLFKALERNNQNTGGAYIEKNNNAYFIRTEGLLSSLEDINNCIVKNTTNGNPILIKDVADVKWGHAIRYGIMTKDDKGEVVGAIVMMLKGANSSQVIKNVKERIRIIQQTLPKGVVIEPYLDRTKLVDNAIGTVAKNLAEGALIVIFVLVLMLGNMRAGLLVASVIPLAMLFAIIMMNLFGISGNLMSLGAIDFGLIIDGAVIIVEATMHHLKLRTNKQNMLLSQEEMNTEVYHSASKIMSSAAFGEIIIMIVYLPILALSGIEGKMFKPMAQTVSFAIIGAFILSLTYVPMMAALVLNKQISIRQTLSDRIIEKLQHLYSSVLQKVFQYQKLIVGSTLVLFILSLLLFANMGGEFIPTLEEGDFAVETRILMGSSINTTAQTAQKAAAILKAHFPEVKTVIGKVGTSEIPTDPMPVEACDLMIILKDKSEWVSATDRNELAEKMSKALEVLPGVSFSFQQPIQMRFNELMTGAKQDVVLKIYGEDFNILSEQSKKLGEIIKPIDGVEDLYVEQIDGLPQIIIRPHRNRIAQFGFTIDDINKAIQTSFAGTLAGKIYEGEKRFDIVMRLDENQRNDINNVKQLYITSAAGQQVPLEQLADVSLKIGPNQIQRDDAKRRIIIGFNTRGRDVESIVTEIQQAVGKKLILPSGYYITYGGAFKNLQEASQRLSIAVPIALLLIFVLLFFTFNSFKYSLLILTAIPLSAIGGVFALYIRSMPFSISAGIGFIALFGIAVLNGIVLISEFNYLKKQNTGIAIKDIVFQGSISRLRPVLMTALVASLGFLPMALSHGNGAEVQKPLATVVIGGLITSTLLTLLVLPILYLLIEKGFKGNKKIIIPTTVILLTFVLLSSNMYAQSNTTNELKAIIEKAIANNPQIKMGIEEINYYKQLKSTASDIGKTSVAINYGQYNSNYKYDNNITISQSIPFPTAIKQQLAQNNLLIKSAEYKAKIAENDLAYLIRDTYYNLLFLYKRDSLLQIQDSLYQKLSTASEAKYKYGESNLLETTTMRTEQQQIANLLQQNSIDIASTLKQLQLIVNTNDALTINPDQALLLTINTANTNTYNSPLINFAQQQAVAAKQAVKLERSKMLPGIILGYTSQTLVGYQVVNGNDVYFGPQKRFSVFQAGLALPLWSKPYTARIKAAKANENMANAAKEQALLNLNVALQQAINATEKNKKTINYYKQNGLPNATLIQQQASKAYQAGEISYMQYLQHLKTVYSIYDENLTAIKNYNTSAIQLLYIQGITN